MPLPSGIYWNGLSPFAFNNEESYLAMQSEATPSHLQRKGHAICLLPFRHPTMASDSKGTLWIHQQGDTECYSGSLDRAHLMSERQSTIDSSKQKPHPKEWIKIISFNCQAILKFKTTHALKLRSEGGHFHENVISSISFPSTSSTVSGQQRRRKVKVALQIELSVRV